MDIPQPTQPAPPPGVPTPPATAPTPPMSGAKPGPTTQKEASKPTLLPNKDEGKKTRRFIYGCCSLFGCSLFLFLGLIFIFIAVGGTTENPIFGLFGVSGPQVVNVIVTITNLIFGILTFIAFILTIIGVFRFATTKKIDKENRKKFMVFTFGSLAIFLLLIFLWIFAYLFLRTKQTPIQSEYILTEPVKTINLTSPVTIQFNASNLPISLRQYEILTYTWNFDDGETRTGNPIQTKTYTDKGRKGGRFDVILRVTVREIATGKELQYEFTRVVSITNERAEVSFEATPEKGEIPLAVKFDASASRDLDGELLAFDWDLDGDGQFLEKSGKVIEYTFDKIGSYPVTLRVTESDGSFTTAQKTVEVISSLTPQAILEIENAEPEGTGGDTLSLYSGANYTFSAAKSTAPAGAIQKYEWDFGDGSPKKTTRIATHSYDTVGDYEVTLKITDQTSRTAESAKRISVRPPASSPVPEVTTNPEMINGKISGTIPLMVEFDAEASSDPDNDLIDIEWDFENDGTVDSHEEKVSFTYEAVGTFEATLMLTDGAGNKTTWSVSLETKMPGLTARLTADPVDGEVPLTVTFDASGSSYAEKRIAAYEWDFGDGSEPITGVATISHQYTKIGTFEAKMVAVGEDDKREETSIVIHVRSIALKACFTASPEGGAAPLEVLFDPGCSSGTVSRYEWKFGDLAESRDRKPTFRFSQAGPYEVQLKVTDPQNVTHTFTKEIRVE